MSYTRSKNGAAKRRVTTSRSRSAASRRSSSAAAPARVDEPARFTESSGNVFEDVGFPPEEARRLLLRSQLAIAVTELVEKGRLTQRRAAKLFGVTQPRMNDLLRGRVDKFSIDMLITMLSRAGMEVRVDVKPKAA